MICEFCKEKPLMRGLQFFNCLSCNTSYSSYFGWFEICNDCSDKLGICNCCGNKITDKYVIGVDVSKE